MNDDHAALLRRHLEAENAHDLDGTLATLHADCVFTDHATGQTWCGHAGAGDHYRHWWRCLDVQVTRGPGQRGGWLDDDHYMAEATWRGRHVGDLLGLAATGREIVQPFVVSVAFRDGLLAGERFHYDLASLLAQLGAARIPELAGLPWRGAPARI